MKLKWKSDISKKIKLLKNKKKKQLKKEID